MPHQPVRTCIGCRTKASQGQMLRLRWDGSQVTVDGVGPRSPGRGAYLCAKMSCWEQAQRRRALGRALRLGGELGRRIDHEAVADAVAGMISGSPRRPQPAPAAAPA